MRALSLLSYALLWVAGGTVLAQVQPGPYASTCARCHPAQALAQPRTPMGRALLLSGANPTLKAYPKLAVRKGGYTHTVETQGDLSTYSVTDGVQTISLPIRWTFGEGAQTWVLERNGKLYESLMSYYPAIGGLDTTTGDEQLTPHTLEEAMGRELTQRESKECFGCHATNALTGDKLTLESLEPGVTCEHCHVGSSTHLWDAIQGVFDSTPPRLGKLGAEDVSSFCGQCHRTWDLVVRNRWRGEVDVRFQPYRLANSRCFDGADPRISCLACHDPHQDVVRQESSYDAKCVACHTSSSQPAAATAPADAKLCPIAKSNCASCHMPKVKLPGGTMTFTDHQIRIVRAGEPYPN